MEQGKDLAVKRKGVAPLIEQYDPVNFVVDQLRVAAAKVFGRGAGDLQIHCDYHDRILQQYAPKGAALLAG